MNVTMKCLHGLPDGSDAYIEVIIPNIPKSEFKTPAVWNNANPCWYSSVLITDFQDGDEFVFSAKDKNNIVADDFIGQGKVHSDVFLPSPYEGKVYMTPDLVLDVKI